jgi:hypothetical protein
MQLLAALRGLLHRGGSTLVILLVALVAAAAAAAGPIYYAAAKTSILHDTTDGAEVIGRGVEAVQTGGIVGLLPALQSAVSGQFTAAVGGPAAAHRLFAPPIEALEVTAQDNRLGQEVEVVWRTNVCQQLRIVRGSCPVSPGQVMISQASAQPTSWHIGQRIRLAKWRPLTITGIYRVPDLNADYWFKRSGAYFPLEEPNPIPIGGGTPQPQAGGSVYDAVFTSQATMSTYAPVAQGTGVIDHLLVTRHLRPADVPGLQSGIAGLLENSALSDQQITVSSEIPTTFATLQASWHAVEVPVFLITVQLLTLSWLLLFLSVTDAVEARGSEVALAKLRGHGRLRTVLFGLSEPTALLILALPLGAAVGWAATSALGKVLLSPGTAVGMPSLGWIAAAVATAGGIAAVILAARRTLRRPVVEQWRRSGRRATDRGWVIDAILLTGAAAGLLDLLFTGQISSTSHNVLGLLVPGLLGLAVAVAASRILPMACRAVFGRSSRRGGLGMYLAVRHIARRPGGVRTTIVLATAFALAAFAVTAWSVDRDNYRLVAGAQVGAPTVLNVITPAGRDFGSIVDKADRSGRMAVAVDVYSSVSSGTTGSGTVTLGVDPQRFARIANWRPSFAAQPLRTLMARIDPPAPTRQVILNGDAFRVRVRVRSLAVPGLQIAADVTTGASPVTLGTLPGRGTVTRTGQLVGCPCVLQDLYLSQTGKQLTKHRSAPITGDLTLVSLQEHAGGRWQTVSPGVLRSAVAWRSANADNPPDVISAGSGGLGWKFQTPVKENPELDSANRPSPLPAVAATAMVGRGTSTGGRPFAAVGLDGNTLPLYPVFPAASIPGAPSYGVIVDRTYAELAAGQNLAQVTQQVWLAPGAQPIVEPRLVAAGVQVTAVVTTAHAAALLSRQGPGLASILFLADAAAAALLASGAAILGLYLSARRRRYEYAALAASGVKRRTLRVAVLIELGAVLGFGTVVGIGAGLGAAALALRSVPEFVSLPVAPPLYYVPSPTPLAVLLGAAVGLLLITSVTSSLTLIRGVRLEQLREAPA